MGRPFVIILRRPAVGSGLELNLSCNAPAYGTRVGLHLRGLGAGSASRYSSYKEEKEPILSRNGFELGKGLELTRAAMAPVATLPFLLNNKHRKSDLIGQQIVGKYFFRSFYSSYRGCMRALASPPSHRPNWNASVGARHACCRSGFARSSSR